MVPRRQVTRCPTSADVSSETVAHHRIELTHEVSIAADAATIYDLVSDVTRTGDWSPECVSARWIDGEPGAVGSTFVGSNYERHPETGQEWTWDMTCQVVEADRPSSFAWSVLTEAWDAHTSVWRYDLDEFDGGVRLTQTYRMDRPPRGWQPILDRHDHEHQLELVEKRRQRLDRGMRSTLEAIKANVER